MMPFKGLGGAGNKNRALMQLKAIGQKFSEGNREFDGILWLSGSCRLGLLFFCPSERVHQSCRLPGEQRSETDLMLVLLIAQWPFFQHRSVFMCQNNLGLCLTQEI